MANEIFTRLQLKHDSYANWDAVKSSFKPLPGEVCVVEIPSGSTAATTAPTVLFKVGAYKKDSQGKDTTELHTFAELPWASGLAADVYAWAKKSTPDWSDFPKLPLEVIDNGTGKFITGISYAGNKLTITRANVAWTDVTGRPETVVESVKATGDSEITLTPTTASNGDVTITAAHSAHKAGSAKTTSTAAVSGYGATGTIKVPKIVTNAAGHVTELTEETVTITMPSEQTINDGTLTLKASDGLTATQQTFSANDADNVTFEVKHGSAGAADTIEGGDKQIITKVSYDKNGHVTEVKAESNATTVNIWDTFATTPDAAGKSAVINFEGPGISTPDIHVLGKGGIKINGLANADSTRNGSITIDGSDLLQAAKDYADAKPHENTAHSHSNGKGTTVTSAGGINGDVKVDLNVAFELVDKTIKLYDKSDSSKTAIAALDATKFIADGMLKSVVADEAKNELVFTWNTDAGVETTTIPFDKIADIYTGKTGTGIAVSVSNTNEISATIENGAVTTAKIADKNVTSEKLSDAVNASLLLANNAKQKQTVVNNKITDAAHVLSSLSQDANGNVSYEVKKLTPADIGAKPTQTAVTAQNLSGAAVIKSVSQSANGVITVDTRNLTPADIGAQPAGDYQPAGNYKTTQTAVAAQNLSGATVIKSVSQNANGVISVATRDLTPADIGAATSAQGELASSAVQEVGITSSSNTLNVSANKVGAVVGITADIKDSGVTTAKIADNAVTTAKLQGARKSTGTDSNEYIVIFNCGTASTVI